MEQPLWRSSSHDEKCLYTEYSRIPNRENNGYSPDFTEFHPVVRVERKKSSSILHKILVSSIITTVLAIFMCIIIVQVHVYPKIMGRAIRDPEYHRYIRGRNFAGGQMTRVDYMKARLARGPNGKASSEDAKNEVSSEDWSKKEQNLAQKEVDAFESQAPEAALSDVSAPRPSTENLSIDNNIINESSILDELDEINAVTEGILDTILDESIQNTSNPKFHQRIAIEAETGNPDLSSLDT